MSDEIIVDGESVTVIEITTGQIGPVGPEGPQGDPGVVDYTGLVLDDDSRLTDSRTPLSHTHPQSDITNLTTDLGNKADLVDGVVPTAQIPSLAINDTFVVANQSAMLALTAETGDIAIRSDLSKTFVLQASPASTLSNWVELSTPTDVITSVNGQTGSVVLGYSDVGAAPTSHTHANTDITGLGTAAVANTGTGASNVILGNDSRLTDTRTPTAASIVDAMIATTLSPSKITGTAAILGANTFTAQQFIDGSADQIQQRIQGHTTQTSNLTTWESSAGSVLASVSASGHMRAINGTLALPGLAVYTAGSYDSGIQGDASGFYMVAQANAAFRAHSSLGNMFYMKIRPPGDNPASIVMRTQGAAAQTANLQNWENSSGAALASVFSDGSLLTPKIYVGSDGVGNSGSFGNASYEPTYGGSRINTSIQTNTALVVRNSHASASGKLQSWQVTTSNTEVASISAAGLGTFAGLTATGNTALSNAGIGSGGDLQGGVCGIRSSSGSPALVLQQQFTNAGAYDLMRWRDNAGTTLGYISNLGKVVAPVATTSTASFNAPHGTAPTSPVDGDMWTTSAGGLFVRVNGVTKQVQFV